MKKVYRIVVCNSYYPGNDSITIHCLARSITHAAQRGLYLATERARKDELGGLRHLFVSLVEEMCELDSL